VDDAVALRARLKRWGLCGVVAGGVLWAHAAAAQPSLEWIRVAVVRDTPEVALAVSGRFTIRGALSGQPIQEGRRLAPTTVRAVPEGIALGAEVLPVRAVRVEPVREAAISLNGTRLRGALEIHRQQEQTLLVVNHVALEDYLRGVLSREAPDYWPAEALQAIAIAARTYALYQRLSKAQDAYDVTGDVMSQEYGGHSGEKAATSRAVRATRGQFLVWQGQLFPAFYHSTCGGMTEHARVMGNFDLAPLAGGVACAFCQASPFYRWQRRLTTADLGWALGNSRYGSVGTVQDLRVIRRTASGRAEQIAIVGTRRTVTLSGYDLRALFGFERIRSPLFSVVRVGEAFVLDGHGWGHGVGMCQWGAAELARRGWTAPQILQFYYPQSEVMRMDQRGDHPLDLIPGGA
jgi:stage II sporulation protein D